MISRKKFLGYSGFFWVGGYAPVLKKLFAAEKKMPRKQVINNNFTLGVIGLGTYKGFDVDYRDPQKDQLIRVLQILFENKLSVIDSSPMYGNAEETTGKLLTASQKKDAFIATKVWTSGKQEGIRQIQNSETYFGKKIDLMQIHNLVDYKTHVKTLRKMKEEGRIRHWGITHYVTSAFEAMIKIMKTDKPDFIQIPYSVALRDAEKKILPLAFEKKTGVLINRPFDGGDLFRTLRKKKFKKEMATNGLNTQAESWAQLMLQYIVSHNAVTCAIPGTANPLHMADNAAAAYLPVLPETEKRKIIRYIESI